MALLTEYASFFISPFGEKSVTDELNAFLRSHRIINVEKKFLDSERGAGWVFLVEYGTGEGGKLPANAPAQRTDYRELLNPAEYALFDKLRVLRKEIADKAGIPVYTIFTNEQLAAMLKKPPETAKDLLSIPGIGEARVKQYGETFLRFFLGERERSPVFGTSRTGLPFLGFLVKDQGIYLLQKSKRRASARMADITASLNRGEITEAKAAERARSVFAAIALARTNRFRRGLVDRGKRIFQQRWNCLEV
ncbi:MAG: HRDC domain-containing protein [Treponema sp.]|jgi:hypothetical protein|nr:HRDC domain-containing protein [Treponema sp.]